MRPCCPRTGLYKARGSGTVLQCWEQRVSHINRCIHCSHGCMSSSLTAHIRCLNVNEAHCVEGRSSIALNCSSEYCSFLGIMQRSKWHFHTLHPSALSLILLSFSFMQDKSVYIVRLIFKFESFHICIHSMNELNIAYAYIYKNFRGANIFEPKIFVCFFLLLSFLIIYDFSHNCRHFFKSPFWKTYLYQGCQ